MIKIQLTCQNAEDFNRVMCIMDLLFDDIHIDESTDLSTTFRTMQIPGDDNLLALLRTREWNSTHSEIKQLRHKSIVSRQYLKSLHERLESSHELSAQLEDAQYKIDDEISKAFRELERIQSEADAYILKADHPALKGEI